MSGIGLPPFEAFVFFIKLGEELLALSGNLVGFGLDDRILLDRFGGLDDDLRLHVDLGVLVFHYDNSGLRGWFRDFDL
jgi:hypothetical protein